MPLKLARAHEMSERPYAAKINSRRTDFRKENSCLISNHNESSPLNCLIIHNHHDRFSIYPFTMRFRPRRSISLSSVHRSQAIGLSIRESHCPDYHHIVGDKDR
jgi:hypothetical protein